MTFSEELHFWRNCVSLSILCVCVTVISKDFPLINRVQRYSSRFQFLRNLILYGTEFFPAKIDVNIEDYICGRSPTEIFLIFMRYGANSTADYLSNSAFWLRFHHWTQICYRFSQKKWALLQKRAILGKSNFRRVTLRDFFRSVVPALNRCFYTPFDAGLITVQESRTKLVEPLK